jgi:hypothetical protein
LATEEWERKAPPAWQKFQREVLRRFSQSTIQEKRRDEREDFSREIFLKKMRTRAASMACSG